MVKSEKSGMGKSLYVERMGAKVRSLLRVKEPVVVTIPLHQRHVDAGRVLAMLLEHTPQSGKPQPRIYHIDISYEVN